jgi:hypothetical protein
VSIYRLRWPLGFGRYHTDRTEFSRVEAAVATLLNTGSTTGEIVDETGRVVVPSLESARRLCAGKDGRP